MPWPSAAEMREARVRAAEERRGGDAGPREDVEPADALPAGSRRKRKRRR